MAISLDRARQLVLASAVRLASETVAIAEAEGRVLAGELRVRADSPPHTNSAMDGFAVRAGPAGRVLRLAGESRAGSPSLAIVDQATAIRIATGGVLPAGAEAVVPLEAASLAGDLVSVNVQVERGRNVRLAGEDMRVGQVALASGTRLGAIELAVAIGAGHDQLVCARRPRVALIATGDELQDPGSVLGEGQVHDSNTIALAALARDARAIVVRCTRTGDDPAAIRRALGRAFGEADLVVISGGVSVGPHDHVKAALGALGAQERFWGVKVRPGRPTWFGGHDDGLVLGLPGNPLPALVIFALLGRPLLAGLEGLAGAAAPERASVTSPLLRHRDRTDVVPVRLGYNGAKGGLLALPTGPQGSHLITSLRGADALALVAPAEDRGLPLDVPRGTELRVERLR